MQHPDEGTIHSWLDGALSAEEAAQVEAHIKECPQCAAAVAEARGFIAASSRILTALDDVPRGVIPAAAAKKRVDPLVWRIAATVLVVAGGTLLVLRTGGRDDGTATKTSATAPVATASTIESATPAPDNATDEMISKPASPTAMQRSSSGGVVAETLPPNVVTAEDKAAKRPAAAALAAAPRELAGSVSGVSSARVSAPPPQPAAPERQNKTLVDQGAGAVAGNASASPGYVGTAAAPSQPLASGIRIRGVSSLGATAYQPPLKVVGTPKALGAKVTLYEVAPGDTVTLTELSQVRVDAAVATATALQRAPQPMQKSAATARPPADTAVGSAADSQRSAATRPLMAVPTVSPSRGDAEVANGVTTITWVDAATGNTLKLSGRVSEAVLRQTRIRIDQERAAAAAAAAKKNP
jgi:anti-sigma factor RsiW